MSIELSIHLYDGSSLENYIGIAGWVYVKFLLTLTLEIVLNENIF